jgi:hypothetical protein
MFPKFNKMNPYNIKFINNGKKINTKQHKPTNYINDKTKIHWTKKTTLIFIYLSNLSSNRQNINAKKKEKKTTLINKLSTLRTSHERRFRGDMLSGF